MLRLRPLDDGDQAWRDATLTEAWGSTVVARLGEAVDAATLAGVVAERDDERVGLATFLERGDELEIVTIQSLVAGIGAGRALLDAAAASLGRVGGRRLWLVTTNDNTRAMHVYQRWGFDLVRLHHEGVALSRLAKPTIPLVGQGGIPLRHELEFEWTAGTERRLDLTGLTS